MNEMKQRNGRQKFLDLRLLTFQDWIHPRNSGYKRSTKIMKNSRLPVFGYTKMDNGPPLSPISSQFAWAGHVLPDLVQEQSDRLLRRLERPMTADGRFSRIRNNQMRGGKISRPVTASPHKSRTHQSTPLILDNRFENTSEYYIAKSEILSHNTLQTPPLDNEDVSPGERSNSPDFIANLYREYEEKIASENHDEWIQCHKSCNTSPPPPAKLLRRPNLKLHITGNSSKNPRPVSKSTQSSPPAMKKTFHIHCVVKLPSDKADSMTETKSRTKDTSTQSEVETKPETWLDLSEIIQSSEDEELRDGMRVPRPSLASESVCSLKLADIPSDNDDDEDHEKKAKLKSRPHSSKPGRKPHGKVKMKKRRPNTAEDLAKTTKKPQNRRIQNSDKLREGIETQMSKLDFSTYTAREPSSVQKQKNLKKSSMTPIIVSKESKTKTDFISSSPPTDSISIFSAKGSLPLKKIPIQILSDPFATTLKIYHRTSQNT